MPSPLRPGSAGHGDALGRVIAGVAAGAENCQEMPVSRVRCATLEEAVKNCVECDGDGKTNRGFEMIDCRWCARIRAIAAPGEGK